MRTRKERPYLTKRDVHEAMREIEDEKDKSGSRYEKAYDELRKALGMID